MGKKLCWICGKKITDSAVGKREEERYYLMVQLVTVNRPYNYNGKTKSIYICHKCAVKKVGVGCHGANLNP